MLKKRVIAALAATLVAGGVSAVEVNPGNKGDVLIAPMVMIAGGWEAELRVVNSDPVNSVVAKVVFHANTDSRELLDFLIYLSPGDVWRGTALKNADGTLGVKSSDDSSLLATVSGGCPASVATATSFDPAVVKSSEAKDVDFTYMKVWESRLITGLGAAPVDKAKVLKAYSDACNAGAPIDAADTSDVLSGDVTLSNASNGNSIRLDMTALAGYNNATYLVQSGLTAFSSNPTNPDALGAQSKARVEDALWATGFVVPYDVSAGSSTYATVTFPTKETYAGSVATQYAPFLNVANKGIPTVALTVRNESEMAIGLAGCLVSPCPVTPANSLPLELGVVTIAGGSGTNTSGSLFTREFTRGWVNMDIQPQLSVVRAKSNYNSFGKSGAPALVTVINWMQRGNSLQGTWNYAAKTQNPAAN